MCNFFCLTDQKSHDQSWVFKKTHQGKDKIPPTVFYFLNFYDLFWVYLPDIKKEKTLIVYFWICLSRAAVYLLQSSDDLHMFLCQMQETQRDVSLDREPLADSVRSCKCPRCVVLAFSLCVFIVAWRQTVTPPRVWYGGLPEVKWRPRFVKF